MNYPEDSLQRAVCQYLDLMGWLYCHVPNGGYRRTREAARLMGLGVMPGVPDLLIFEAWSETFPGHGLPADGAGLGACGHGIAIELKSEKGRLRPEQREWLDGLEQRGWLTQVCRSLDEVIAVCERIRR